MIRVLLRCFGSLALAARSKRGVCADPRHASVTAASPTSETGTLHRVDRSPQTNDWGKASWASSDSKQSPLESPWAAETQAFRVIGPESGGATWSQAY